MDGDSDILEVSPTGDIILVVGPPEEKQLRLRVSSTILRSASKVFDAMFSPPWIESSCTLSLEAPKDIDLPDDDPEAMKAICYAIHHRPDMIPFAEMDGKHILQAVRTIDKYDLFTTMQMVTDRWFRQVTPYRSSTDLMYLVAAAEMLKKFDIFPKLTWLVMIIHVGSYLSFHEDKLLMDTLPPKLLTVLAERSLHLRTSLLAAVRNIAIGKYECVRGTQCTAYNSLNQKSKAFVEKFDCPSGNQRSILEIINAMMPIANLERAFQEGYCYQLYNQTPTKHSERLPVSETIFHKLTGWTERQTSVCLGCLQSGSLTEVKCKHKRVDGFAQLDRLFLY